MSFVIILAILSLITHFLFFGHPVATVFDEVYHGNFINAYSSGQYFFDIHPPLARLLIKFFGDVIGVSHNIDFGQIGNALPQDIILLRFLPLIAGTILPIIIYFICRNLNFSKISSFTAGTLICLENSLIVQSRFILFDSMLILFGFSALLLYLIYIKKESKYLLLCSAMLAAAAFSVKWTGLAFPLLIAILEIIRIKNIKKIAKFISVYAIIGLILYISVFAIHFSYLKSPGPGDVFMTKDFQSKSFFGKFVELNREMYRANAILTAKHDYSSPWYTWPFMLRPVFYWQDLDKEEYIYLLGNPLIYWLGILSIIILMLKKNKDKITLFILLGFFVNFIPFIFIGRAMFLYHYEAALVFSIIAIVYLLQRRTIFQFILLGLLLIIFTYFSPLTYGLHLNQSQLQNRMWLSSWR